MVIYSWISEIHGNRIFLFLVMVDVVVALSLVMSILNLNDSLMLWWAQRQTTKAGFCQIWIPNFGVIAKLLYEATKGPESVL